MAERFDLGLATSQEDFEKLWAAVYGVRVDVGTVTVSKKALTGLLYDHAQLVGACEEDLHKTITIINGDPDAIDESLRALNLYRSIDSKK